MTTTEVNGKKYWIKENSNNAIWFNNELSNDLWIVGAKNYVGTLTGGIHTKKTNQCPNNEVDTWRYFSVDIEDWVDAGSDIQITCVIQDRIMNTYDDHSALSSTKQLKNIEQDRYFSKLSNELTVSLQNVSN